MSWTIEHSDKDFGQLLPCPFCGSAAEMLWHSFPPEDEQRYYYVRCTDSGCFMHFNRNPQSTDAKSVAAKWNRRNVATIEGLPIADLNAAGWFTREQWMQNVRGCP